MRSGYARTTVLIAAATVGLATIALIYLSLAAPWKRPSKAMPVVVAAEDISADTVVSPSMLRVATVPESQLLPDAATRTIDVIHKVTSSPIRTGEQFVTTTLMDKATAFGLAGIIPPGTRAMTVTVDSADAVSGFLQPGDHIDVLATFTQGTDSVARTILQNVVLLAVNTSLRSTAREQAQEPGKAPASSAQGQAVEATATKVTIAVTPSEAERLVAAQYKGKLKIGLRGINDASRPKTSGASVNAIFGIVEKPPMGAPFQQQPQPGQASVRISEGRLTKQRMAFSQAQGFAALPPFPSALRPEPKKIRVIKGDRVQEVEVAH